MRQNSKKISTVDNNEIYSALCLISVSFANSIAVQFTASLWQFSKTPTKQFMNFSLQKSKCVVVIVAIKNCGLNGIIYNSLERKFFYLSVM